MVSTFPPICPTQICLDMGLICILGLVIVDMVNWWYFHLIGDWSSECSRLRRDHWAHLWPLLAEFSRPAQWCWCFWLAWKGREAGRKEGGIRNNKPAGLKSGGAGYQKAKQEQGHHIVQHHQRPPHRYHRIRLDSNFPLLYPPQPPWKVHSLSIPLSALVFSEGWNGGWVAPKSFICWPSHFSAAGWGVAPKSSLISSARGPDFITSQQIGRFVGGLHLKYCRIREI